LKPQQAETRFFLPLISYIAHSNIQTFKRTCFWDDKEVYVFIGDCLPSSAPLEATVHNHRCITLHGTFRSFLGFLGFSDLDQPGPQDTDHDVFPISHVSDPCWISEVQPPHPELFVHYPCSASQSCVSSSSTSSIPPTWDQYSIPLPFDRHGWSSVNLI